MSRMRRGSVSSPRHDFSGTDPIGIAGVPPRRVSGKSRRVSYQSPRQGKLTIGQKAVIRANGGNQSLRELAAEFGVSHETIRTVLREPALAPID